MQCSGLSTPMKITWNPYPPGGRVSAGRSRGVQITRNSVRISCPHAAFESNRACDGACRPGITATLPNRQSRLRYGGKGCGFFLEVPVRGGGGNTQVFADLAASSPGEFVRGCHLRRAILGPTCLLQCFDDCIDHYFGHVGVFSARRSLLPICRRQDDALSFEGHMVNERPRAVMAAPVSCCPHGPPSANRQLKRLHEAP